MGDQITEVVELDGFFIEISENRVVSGDVIKDKALGDELVGGVSEIVTEKMIDLKDTIARVCNYVKGAFTDEHRPDEFTVEFGLKVAAVGQVPYIAKGSGEAAILIRATWKKADKSPDTTSS